MCVCVGGGGGGGVRRGDWTKAEHLNLDKNLC